MSETRYVHMRGCLYPVEVLDETSPYGRLNVTVRPVGGYGEQRIWAERALTLAEARAAYPEVVR